MGSRGPNRFGDALQVGAAGPTPPFPLLGADLDQRQAELDAQFNATVGAGHRVEAPAPEAVAGLTSVVAVDS
eukprot:15450816-Alexandrium_andersonii.AAC.1